MRFRMGFIGALIASAACVELADGDDTRTPLPDAIEDSRDGGVTDAGSAVDGGAVVDAGRAPDAGQTSSLCKTDDDCSQSEMCTPEGCRPRMPVPCDVNQFVQSGACVACPPGSTNEAGDNALGADTSCDATQCEQDQRVLSNACVACPPGTTNSPGDNATGEDTECDGALCSQDRFVQNNTCVACPPGSVNQAGDNPAGPDTECDAVLCGADERVENNACVFCEPGSTNAAGDDATGIDTECDAFLCGVDERVEDHACVACPPGSTNEAGDDATGPNTQCDAAVDACEAAFGLSCPDFREGYLKASNTGQDDTFGFWVALSGDGNTAVVGAPQEDSPAQGVNSGNQGDGATDSGAAYVFVRDAGGTWSQQAYLKASVSGAGEAFGSAAALSFTGDTLVVSAFREDDVPNGGAAYVFQRNGGASWSQETILRASNAGPGDFFGESVAISSEGDTVAVGAALEDSAATGVNGNQGGNAAPDSGAVYVFVRSDAGAWSQQAYIKASNTNAGDAFGFSVAISGTGDRLVVGAPSEDGLNNGAPDAGAVYIFERTGPEWTEQAYLTASNADADDRFGASVTVSADGDTIAVGAWNEASGATDVNGDRGDNAAPSSGAVFVYRRGSGSPWPLRAFVKASNTDIGDLFGYSVAVSASGETMAVSAVLENGASTGVSGDESSNGAPNSGAVFVRRIAPLNSQ